MAIWVTCPVEGCDRHRDRAHVMCLPCWKTVPQEMRDNVWRTYKTGGAWSDEAVEAREAAIQFVEHALARAALP